VHGRAHAAACAQPAHQLVRDAEVVVPGHLVGIPVCWVNSADSMTNPLKSATSLASQLLQQGVEIFQLGVLDDYLAAAVVIFNMNLEAQGAL
jgi:hypothetical protein